MNFNISFLGLVLLLSFCFLKQGSSFALHPEGRIAGGHDAKAHSAPYIVSLQVKQKSQYVHFCGGSIINQNWIVTAGHCLQTKKEALLIQAGRHNIGLGEDTAQERSVDLMIVHHLYNGGVGPYDIGLIFTAKSFKWTNAVKPIALPKSEQKPSGQATLFGWGSISKDVNPIFPNTLQTADLKIIELSECRKLLSTAATELVHETNVCTGSPAVGISACSSDSGGPLVQKDKLIGIVSWGEVPCGQPNKPSVYVLVSKFVKWIEDKQKNPKQ